MSLSNSADGTVRCGDRVMLAHVAGAVLAADQHGQALTARMGASPCVATVFTVRPSVEHTEATAPLCFGQRFYLELEKPGVRLFSAPLHRGLAAMYSGHQAVTLCVPAEFSAYDGHWRVDALDEEERLELEGTPVPASKPVLLVHTGSNQCLAVEEHMVPSPLGVAFEVSAHAYRTQHKTPGKQNQWTFLMNHV